MFGFHGFRLKVLQVAGGTALSQGMLVLASPLLTRLYSPADFGVLAVYLSLVSILVIVASLRYEFALPIPEDDGEAVHLLAVCLLLVATTTSLAAVALYLARDRVLAWMGAPGLGPYLFLVPVSILGAGFYQVFNCWAIRKGGYGRIARTKVTQGLTTLGLQLAVGALAGGPVGLLVGDAAGRTNGTRTLAMLDWREDWRRLQAVTPAGMWRAVVRYRRFPFISSSTAVMNTLNLRLPALLLAIHFGPAVAGGFVLAQRVFALPSSVIGESVAQVYFGEFARLNHQDADGLMSIFKGTVQRMVLLGVPLMVLTSLAGWLLFPIVFGPAWSRAGLFVVAIAPMACAQFSFACADSSLLVLERQDLAFYREVLRSSLLVGAILGAYVLRLEPIRAVFLFGGAGTVAYVGYGLITWYAIHAHRGRLKGAA
jgi:O-antigen/teichoic acid export membrane protein